MPRITRTERRRRKGYDQYHYRELLRGDSHWDRDRGFQLQTLTGDDLADALEDARALWAAEMDDIMTEWVQLQPCSRPAAWHRFDGPYRDELHKRGRWQRMHRDSLECEMLQHFECLTPAELRVYRKWVRDGAVPLPEDQGVRGWWYTCATWSEDTGVSFCRLIGGQVSDEPHPIMMLELEP